MDEQHVHSLLVLTDISWKTSNSAGVTPPMILDPAYFSGQGAPTHAPNQPICATFLNSSLGSCFASSHSCAYGMISASTKPRIALRKVR